MSSAHAHPQIIRHVEAGETCCDPEWEAAYKRFETPEEEIEKFIRRLRAFGLDRQPKDIRIAELFCGRGGGLAALNRIGLTNVEGVDLSETLLQEYRGNATLHLADCRSLPFDDHSFDAAIVHGGLHHLPTLPADLESVLSEVSRILKPGGTFYVVEPWQTPFLRFAHFVVSQPLVRRFYRKGDALAAMTEHEIETYEQWLGQPNEVLDLFRRFFVLKQHKTAWGKLVLSAIPADAKTGRSHSASGGNS
jgi:ubiquinone/menaquinone biosynthesis C-methylase UbiE